MEEFSSDIKHTTDIEPSVNPVIRSDNNEIKKGSTIFPQKTFQMRSSILTELLEVSHIRSIRQIFISILVILVLQVIMTDLFETGASVNFCSLIFVMKLFIFHFRIDFRFDVIRWNFSNLSSCFRLWTYLFLCTCTVIYCCFHYWAYKRLDFMSITHANTPKKSTSLCETFITPSHTSLFIDDLVLFDWFCLIGYCLYIALFLYLPVHCIIEENYPIATRIIILIEQVNDIDRFRQRKDELF